MPITVIAVPLRVIDDPSAAGSPPNRRCQKARVITTTGVALPGCDSSCVNRRPRSAVSPSTSKNEPVTNAPMMRCG